MGDVCCAGRLNDNGAQVVNDDGRPWQGMAVHLCAHMYVLGFVIDFGRPAGS